MYWQYNGPHPRMLPVLLACDDPRTSWFFQNRIWTVSFLMFFREGIAHFLKKKMGQNYRYKKCTRRGYVRYKKLVPDTKVHFSRFMTHGNLESRQDEWYSFCLPCQCRTWDQENEIFTDKTHLLNQQMGRERVGGREVLLRRGGCDNSKECMTL